MTSNNHQASLTAHLLSTHSPACTSATRRPFLTHAGNGTLADSTVCEWLVQDKYYQLGYVNFIGSLLSKLDLSKLASPSSSIPISQPNAKLYPQDSHREATQQSYLRTTMDVLIDALSAIRQEMDFYNQTAEKYELRLEHSEMSRVTREYVELFREAGKEDRGILQGLVVLWATEHCYLSAWTYASSQAKDADVQSQLGTTGTVAALHREFIPNWTSAAFTEFVDKLASVTDAWAIASDDEEREACQSLWDRVLQLEARFWPEV